MMLQALLAYAEREHLGDADFEEVSVHWQIPVASSGELAGDPIPLNENPTAKRRTGRRLRRPFTSPNELNQGKTSYFLCDTLQRATCFEAEDKTAAQHAFFMDLLNKAALACPGEAALLGPIEAYLGDEALRRDLHARLAVCKAKPSDNVEFSVDGVRLLERAALQNYWRQRRALQRADAPGGKRICLATGEWEEILKTHEKIKRVPGANSSGANLISFNKESFCSYGLEQAENAPLSAAAELETRSALQALVDKSAAQKLAFGDSIFLHWSREALEFDPVEVMATADPEAVERLVRSVERGRKAAAVDAAAYFAMSISGNGARIVVRDWLESTVADVSARMGQWFKDLAVIDERTGQVRREFGIRQLLSSLENPKLQRPHEALPHGAAEDLFRAALTGGAPPRAILSAAVRRELLDRAESQKKGSRGDNRSQGKSFLPARFALLRLCLNRLLYKEVTVPEQLATDSNDSAYLCGQLFAVLGRLQLLALGPVGAGIADRTYGGVATRPASTLAPIFSKVPAYVKKANDRYPGAGTNKQKEVESLCERLHARGGLPRTLGLEEQARFAIAYYCQIAAYRARREEEEAAKRAEEAGEESD